MTIHDLFSIFTQIISLFLLIGGISAFFFKSYIKEWVKSKFKSQLQKANEDYKQKFIRELEAYKASLVRELEEYKLNIDLKRNIGIQYSDKKLKAFELISVSYSILLIDIVKYSKLESTYKEPFLDFKIRSLNRLGEIQQSLHPYDFYIEALSVGLRLADLYINIVNLFKNEDCLAEDEEIDKVVKDFGIIKAMMKDELLGSEHTDKYITSVNIDYLEKQKR